MATAAFNPQIFLSEAGAGKKILRCRNKQIVYSQGDPGSALFYLTRGRVKLVVTSPQGKEAVVGLLGPGRFFWAGEFDRPQGRLATAVAMSECVVTRLEKSLVSRLLRQEHEFSEMFVAYLLGHIVRVQEDLIDQLFNSFGEAAGPYAPCCWRVSARRANGSLFWRRRSRTKCWPKW